MSMQPRHAATKPSRIASRRARILVLIIGVTVGLGFLGAGVALGYFLTTASNPAQALADTLPTGATPSATVIPTNTPPVTITFATTATKAGTQVTSYSATRYNANTGASAGPISGSCSTVSTTVTCTDSPGAGSWKYTDTPTYGTNWFGGESAKSNSATLSSATGLSPTTGTVGSSASISAQGFMPGGSLTVTVGGKSAVVTSGGTVGSNGSSTVSFTIPALAHGSQSVLVSDGTNSATSPTPFTVTQQITLSGGSVSAANGYVGDTVTITGTGFAGSSNIGTHTYNGSVVTLNPTIPQTDGSGSFTATFVVPASPAGSHNVSVTDSSSNTASTAFTVNAQILALSSTSGPVGTTVTVTGNGFAASATTLKDNFGGSGLVTMSGTTSSSGVLTNASFIVPTDPDVALGYSVLVSDGTNSATSGINYTVTPQILSLSSTTGTVGTTVTVTGNGFKASASSVSLVFGGTTFTMSGTTSSSGVLSSASFTVPAVADVSGGYTVAISDGTNTSANYGTNYTVTPQILSLSSTTGTVGTTVTVTGNGFKASASSVSLVFGGTTFTMSGTTSSSGVLSSASFTVPAVADVSGGYTVAISDGTNTSANYTTKYTVTPQILSLSSTTGTVGTTVTVTGNGFKASASSVSLVFGGTTFTMSGTTSSSGVLSSASFTVPAVADVSGGYTVAISDGTNTSANYGTNYTVTPQILSLSSTTGTVGTTVTVTGNGFKASASSVSLVFGGTTFTMSGTTSSSGVLSSASFTVPAVADVSGGYTVAISDGTNTSANYGTNYTVTPQILSLSSTTGTVGTTVTVTGNGFKASASSVSLVFGGTTFTMSGTTSSSGVLSSASFTVPAVADVSGGSPWPSPTGPIRRLTTGPTTPSRPRSCP